MRRRCHSRLLSCGLVRTIGSLLLLSCLSVGSGGERIHTPHVLKVIRIRTSAIGIQGGGAVRIVVVRYGIRHGFRGIG